MSKRALINNFKLKLMKWVFPSKRPLKPNSTPWTSKISALTTIERTMVSLRKPNWRWINFMLIIFTKNLCWEGPVIQKKRPRNKRIKISKPMQKRRSNLIAHPRNRMTLQVSSLLRTVILIKRALQATSTSRILTKMNRNSSTPKFWA